MERKFLRDVSDIQTGPFGSQLHEKDYVLSGGIPIVTVEHLGSRHFTTQNLPLVSDADRDRLQKYVAHTGDIVFSRVGSVDRCSFVSPREDGWMFSGRCLRVRPCEMVDGEFLYYYLCQPSIRQYIRDIAVGTTMPSINTSLMGDVSVEYPDLPTQRRIAAVLGALDDKIEVNRKICESLEAQAQALFKAWFVDFEPFGGKRPEGWKMGKLGNVADCNQRSYSAKEAWPEVSYLDTGSITKNVIAEVQLLPMDKAPSRARRKVRQYSIVYSTVRPNLCHYGIIVDVKENMLVSTGFAVVDAKEGYSPFHAYLALTSEDVTTKLHALAEQSVCTYPALNPEDVMAVDILIPTLDVEKRFDDIVRPMFELIEKKSQESRALAAMRDALLPKLMSGELAVEKVEG